MTACATLPIAISRQIWNMKYRLKTTDGEALDKTVEDTWRRVARAAARAELGHKRGRKAKTRKIWESRFYDAMADFAFLPAGRILAGAGTRRRVTLFNCFVMGRIDDSLKSIFASLREAALTMQQGGGIGQDFSTLRPRGAPVASIGAAASGPVSFMDVWDAMCRTIMSAGARRGAMMGTMACDHPDIEDFIAAKAETRALRNFNLSVLVSDDFMRAVRDDAPWDLQFDGRIYRTVSAAGLWRQIMRASYDYAEPGVIFIDRINAMNNLSYCEQISCTNPCGEQPLPPHGACLLGSINLARLIERPFTRHAALDETRLNDLAATAVRFLDNIIDVSGFPLKAQKREAKAKRRIGLGITGLADALIMAGLQYDSAKGRAAAERWMARLQRAAYLASSALAAEKGAFPLFDRDKFLAAPGPAAMDREVRRAIAAQGMRNGLVTSIAPTGTISLFAGNLSSGIEPVFDLSYKRRIVDGSLPGSGGIGVDGGLDVAHVEGGYREEIIEDYAYRLYQRSQGKNAPLPDTFVTAMQLPPGAHLKMQAALQRHVDSSISKTINCPADMAFADFKEIYGDAYDLRLKGCTTFRPNAITGAVLQADGSSAGGNELAGKDLADVDVAGKDVAGKDVADMDVAGKDAEWRCQPANLSVDGQATPDAAALSPPKDDGVVYMAAPLQRQAVLQGRTYKLKWPGSDHAIYVTINDIEQADHRRPFEIFINSKNLEHYAWTVALTRMISAVFRRGGDVSFVVEELKAIFDPQGGRWMDGHYVPSLIAAIGEIIETHMIGIGFLQKQPDADASGGKELLVSSYQDRDKIARKTGAAARATTGAATGAGGSGVSSIAPGRSGAADAESANEPDLPDQAGQIPATQNPGTKRTAPQSRRLNFCPRCAQPALQRKEGCWICRDCGYSRCS